MPSPKPKNPKGGRPKKRVDRIATSKLLGRPRRYDPQWHPQAVVDALTLERTVKEICEQWRIHPETFYAWQRDFPDFSDAVARGRHAQRDLANITLQKRLEGYSYTEEVLQVDSKGYKVRKRLKKHVPPDVTAAIHVQTRMDRMAPKVEIPQQMVDLMEAIKGMDSDKLES